MGFLHSTLARSSPLLAARQNGFEEDVQGTPSCKSSWRPVSRAIPFADVAYSSAPPDAVSHAVRSS